MSRKNECTFETNHNFIMTTFLKYQNIDIYDSEIYTINSTTTKHLNALLSAFKMNKNSIHDYELNCIASTTHFKKRVLMYP